jgi:hypothetical protein
MQPTNNAMNNSLLSNDTRQVLDDTTALLDNLITQVRKDIGMVNEPKAQALFETTAEVLLGLKKAYQDYEGGGERAWQ